MWRLRCFHDFAPLLAYLKSWPLTHQMGQSRRWGLGLEYARSYHAARLKKLLLIGTLGMFIVWLNGILVKTNQWARHFQANTDPSGGVLSTFFLGQRLLFNRQLRCSKRQITTAFRRFPLIAEKQVNFVGIA